MVRPQQDTHKTLQKDPSGGKKERKRMDSGYGISDLKFSEEFL